MIKEITESNFLIYSVKNYDNPQCISTDEFNNDIKILMYIKRLLRKYKLNNKLQERLLINHITTIVNLFGVVASVRMLFFYCENNIHDELNTIFISMSILPSNIPETKIHELNINHHLMRILRKM